MWDDDEKLGHKHEHHSLPNIQNVSFFCDLEIKYKVTKISFLMTNSIISNPYDFEKI